MHVRPMRDEEEEIVRAWLMFNRAAAVVRLENTPWWRFDERAARKRVLAVFDALLAGLDRANHLDPKLAERVLARVG